MGNEARRSRTGRPAGPSWASRAIDIGHISAGWANVFAGGKWPERLELRRSR